MKRTVAPFILALVVATSACGRSSKSTSSGSTTTTNADAYRTAYTVCLQFYNTDKGRNAEPPTLTDDQADEVFVGLALQLKPALQKDPRAWSKLNRAALKVRADLMASNVNDDAIEKAITDMSDACQAAKKPPKGLPTVQVPVSPSGTGSPTSTAPTSTSVPA